MYVKCTYAATCNDRFVSRVLCEPKTAGISATRWVLLRMLLMDVIYLNAYSRATYNAEVQPACEESMGE